MMMCGGRIIIIIGYLESGGINGKNGDDDVVMCIDIDFDRLLGVHSVR
jgi:hypothetical protein